MKQVFVAAVLLVTACAAPPESRDTDDRLAYWATEVKRFMHMHNSESELRKWLSGRRAEISFPAQGTGFSAVLETTQESEHLCKTDIVLVGEIVGARILWHRVDAVRRTNCADYRGT